MNVRVVKLGGSLLDAADFPTHLRHWLAAQSPATNLVIVGGGALVNSLREFDRRHSLSPTTAHWLCVRAMSLTAALVAELLPEASLVSALEPSRTWANTELLIFEVEQFLREDQQGSNPLPCSWDVTSDSIAARVAASLPARELVLLKSALPQGPASREAWSRAGFVDACFARVSQAVPLRCVNLRNPEFPQVIADA